MLLVRGIARDSGIEPVVVAEHARDMSRRRAVLDRVLVVVVGTAGMLKEGQESDNKTTQERN